MVKSQIFTLAFIGYPFAPSFFIFLSRAPRSFSRARYARELTNVFEKNEKKSKTTSVYRLEVTIPGKEKFSFSVFSWYKRLEDTPATDNKSIRGILPYLDRTSLLPSGKSK